jgi:site-specific recombinase XerD
MPHDDTDHRTPLLRHPSRFSGQDGVTTEQREQPPSRNSRLQDFETQSRESRPVQPPLFDIDTALANAARVPPATVALLPGLDPHSSLDLARTWYRRTLEQANRPKNTIESYCYDLLVLEQLVGPKPVDEIDKRDIAHFLGEATNKSTRKRRLTSARRFFRYLIEEQVLGRDPTEGYFPHSIELRLPLPLFAAEQADLLEAAKGDEDWSAAAIWLMMRLGLTRSELLGLQRDHIDRTQVHAPVVTIYYADAGKRAKERTLITDREFAELYDTYLETTGITGVLFPVGPPAVNGMVERVRRLAGITKPVTPQTLRHTYAVEQARDGADQEKLLALLGLSDDPRNRASVDRYIRLAHAANEPAG